MTAVLARLSGFLELEFRISSIFFSSVKSIGKVLSDDLMSTNCLDNLYSYCASESEIQFEFLSKGCPQGRVITHKL